MKPSQQTYTDDEITEAIRRADTTGLFRLPPRRPNRTPLYITMVVLLLTAAGILSIRTVDRLWVEVHCNPRIGGCP